MKLPLIAALGFGLLAQHAVAADATTLKDQKDKTSYAIGIDIGKNLKRNGLELSVDALAAGFKDAYNGGKLQMTDIEIAAAMQALQMEMQQKMAAKQQKIQEEGKAKGEKNKTEGPAFLAANKSKEGVKTTASGLQYKVIKEGTGKSPKASDTVTTHYRGTLLDGTEFDSSYKRGEPAVFEVGQVIRGWTEALQLMKEGSKYQLFIPSTLAYGENGTPDGSIAPHSTLIFEVELISVGAK